MLSLRLPLKELSLLGRESDGPIMQKVQGHKIKFASLGGWRKGSGSFHTLRVFSPFPHGTGTLSDRELGLAFEGGPPTSIKVAGLDVL